ncbi:hypothetical protein GCM10007972_15680 [Iodidimonas muriae]|uniref:UmuC domain-containing protein n=1 Tax=Iodidimonas muriae TaxID=261467 RepID=A0ABQ2LDI0_9PROT|nr:hypothetical protein JCM17843_31060 [Kordiimonadales bacterium JCM 17843]GGO11677.1 hypothetical protein GCM10007972_15680 [Iodidimonas muriae]
MALTLAGPRGLRLYACNPAAKAAGLHNGMAFADARAMVPMLVTQPADLKGDAAALSHLTRWCGRWSPWVRMDGEDGIWIDASGCAHLFGGEVAMLKDIQTRLRAMGIKARLAMADTPGAAWAAARYGQARIILSGEARRALASFPVAALRIKEEAAASLRRLGLKRIGDLYDLPRAMLAQRFGPGGAKAVAAVLHRLDQALGQVFEPIDPVMPVPLWRVRLPLVEPLMDINALMGLVAPLLEDLAARLMAEEKGVRRLSLTAFRCDGSSERLIVGTYAPSRDPAHMARLFQEKVGSIDPGFGIDCLVVAAEVVAPLDAAQTDFDGQAAGVLALSELIDRLALRLGKGHVGHARPFESHIPERAEQRVTGYGETTWTNAMHPSGVPPAPTRPLRLLPRPEPVEVVAEVPEGPPLVFRWRRVQCRVARSQGPERVAPEWWRVAGEEARIRDYYRVEDDAGRRYWLFRAGLYEETTDEGPCRWFLHGLFA